MPQEDVRISIPLRHGPLEIVGSEEFVTSQLESFHSLIFASSEREGPDSEVGGAGSSTDGSSRTEGTEPGLFPHVLDVHDDIVRVIVPIPGAATIEKTINAALLGLLGAKMLRRDTLSFSEIREICASHGFLDVTNFAKYLKDKRARSLLLVTGSGKSQSVRLTVGGLTAARNLATSLNGQEQG